MAHYNIPQYIWFVEEFPMTVTGKIQKFRMRGLAIEKLRGRTTQGITDPCFGSSPPLPGPSSELGLSP
jgi:hypothetical protein